MNRIILTFHSTHDAIATERLLESHAIEFQVMPTPVEISADCGIALLLGIPEGKQSRELLADTHMMVGFSAAHEDGLTLDILGPFID
jgi:hypothetical protein